MESHGGRHILVIFPVVFTGADFGRFDHSRRQNQAFDKAGGMLNLQSIYKKTLSAQQLMYAAAVFIIASNLLTKTLYQYTQNQSWVAVLVAIGAGLLLVTLYGRLITKHDGRNLYEINGLVFGIAGGKLISALYVFYFFTLTVFNTRDLGSFVGMFVLQATPHNIVYVFFLLVCAFAVKKGADKMTRYGTMIFCIYAVLIVFLTSLLIPLMDFKNFEPVFTVPLKNQLLSAHLVTMLPFGEVIVFLVMTQYMAKPETTGKALRRGLLLGALVILILNTRSTAVLGDYTRRASGPIFLSIRLIDVGDILTRLEIINAVLQMVLLFFKTSILYYVTVKGFIHLFNIKQHEPFTMILGALVLISAGFFFQNSSEHTLWFSAAATYSTFFLLILPACTMLISSVKGREKGKPNGSQAPASYE
jgi:spore germination protein KB